MGAGGGEVGSVESEPGEPVEPVESGTGDVGSVESGPGDAVLVSVVGEGSTGPRLLTLVKMKGLAFFKQKREQEHQCKKKKVIHVSQ